MAQQPPLPYKTPLGYSCRLYTQRIYVRLDRWDVYRKHIHLTPLLTEGRLSRIQTHETVEHAHGTITQVLEQLPMFLVTQADLSGKERPNRFLGGLIAAAAAVGSLFSIGPVSLSALQRHMSKLHEEMPEIHQKSNSENYKTVQGSITSVMYV